MTSREITYLVFGIVLIMALAFDLGLFSKKNKVISIRQALYQTLFWVVLAMAFFAFIWIEDGQSLAFQYISGYLMEWSLSIDNIFVFILIFSAFSVKEKYSGQVLLIGIMMAIIFRVIFITVGVALVNRFEWILYIFGAFLVYTGIKMFTAKEEEEFDPHQSKIYKFLNRFLPLVPNDGNGRYIVRTKRGPVYTTLFVVVIMLAMTDLVFAFDSIPAVMGISRNKMVIYTSNIFAVLGLRSMFFLLKGAVNRFEYLQQGIAIVLVFIGLKMLAEIFHFAVPIYWSLMVIVVCLGVSIIYSLQTTAKKEKKE